MNTVKLNQNNIKLLGRTVCLDDQIYCMQSGAGIEFRFSGKCCTITVAGDRSSHDKTMAECHARLAIYVNGVKTVDDVMDCPEKTFHIVASATTQQAVVTLLKLSEAKLSTFAIKKISIDGNISPTANKDRLIEFVGDSLTCG